MGKFTIRMIIMIFLALAAGVLFYAAFLKIPVPGVCGLFPSEKEDLVRHYACSLAICTKGCNWVENNEICLERDCTTEECKEWCYSYCEKWGNPDRACGYGYYMEVPLEQNVALKGCDRKYLDWGIWAGTSDMHYLTEIYDMIKSLFPTLITEDEDGFQFELLDDGCRGVGGFYHPGLIFDKTEIYRWDSPRFVWHEWPIKGTGGIFLDPVESMRSFGCIDTSVPVYWGIPVPVYETAPGYYQCFFKGNLKIWSEYKEGSDGCGDVWINTSYPPPATFRVEVTPCDGKDRCNGKCERIRLNEEACFDVKVINDLGTGTDFNLEMDCTDGPCESVGCSEPCTDKFEENRLSVGQGKEGTTQLKFTPTATGGYKIWVYANPTAAYDVETDVVELRVVDFKVELSPNRREVQENENGVFRVDIDNQLDLDATFDLSYNCAGCSCTFDSDSLFVSEGEKDYTYIRCQSPNTGEYYITVTATKDSFSKTSNSVTLNVVKCWGDISLSINPNAVEYGQNFNVNASGLSECSGEMVIFDLDSLGSEIGRCDPAEGGGSGCTEEFTATYSLGVHTIYAKIDLDGDGNYEGDEEIDSANLTIFGFIPDSIDILRRSQTGPWTTGITSWGGTAETNYINPSWYGPTVSWRGYVRAQAGTCCWATGSDVRRLHIRFNNINTGQATNEISTTGYLRDVWNLGTVSDAGYWQVQVYSDDGCGWAGTWWCPIPRIWEGTMIALVTYP